MDKEHEPQPTYLRVSQDGQMYVTVEYVKHPKIDPIIFNELVYPAFEYLMKAVGDCVAHAVLTMEDYGFHHENIERCLRQYYMTLFFKEDTGLTDVPKYND